jgi:hypothetical protein
VGIPTTAIESAERITSRWKARTRIGHFDVLPDDVNWGLVGTLDHYVARLREIADSAFGESEHAG